MDLRQIEEDREASLVFLGMKPGTFDGTQGAAALVEWLHDMETIFGLYHIKAHLQVMLASRRLNPEVPLASAAPAGLQADPPMVREDLLYEWFRRMKAPEFEGLTDPIEADNWIIDIQVILDFMGLTELEKDKFNSMRQGSMTVLEAVKRFEQLARLCPEIVPNETEKVRTMMKMFQTDIAKQVSAGSIPPTLVADCISRAIRDEYWINQDKEARLKSLKLRRKKRL
ncbi:hypothetical protein TIFTF001_036977 [Ficus carica]|nr:hypothetical protein TIFTF001_036977 [Ficus carica]